ncbi:MAG: Transposase DDE domain protein [Bacteroidetes bacterium ADurb.Bin012]|nr:MAG: Transposase DDE domain protein [Bacteroidetes bacterium ADurb.Bin012]
MFVRSTTHTDNKSGKPYNTYKLVESIRTERGPRQRTVLNLGTDFSLDRGKWEMLANRIETIVSGQQCFIPADAETEKLAQRYAKIIIYRESNKKPVSVQEQQQPDFQEVDVNSLENEEILSVGGESIVLSTIRELKLDSELESLGFNKSNVEAAIGVICARLLAPSSERAAHLWLQNDTALDDLLDTSFASLSQDRVYQVSDKLLKHKDAIETYLQKKEKQLFNLEEKVILYDLTNTFFEGSGKYNQKAHFGVSKEKRNDCLLVTLALLLDGEGFPQKSEILAGNISEPDTLKNVLTAVSTQARKPIVVADAGIGTEKNIKWLSENGYSYIVVSRKRQQEVPADIKLIKVRENSHRVVSAAARMNNGGEMEVYCHSTAKEIKEQEIRNRFERRFEDNLKSVCKALQKKYGTKRYEKVLEKIGRLKERYRRVANRYNISIDKDDKSGNATDIKWSMKQKDCVSGYYLLRSNLTDMSEKEIFDTFTMLLDLEDAFRSMKSELGLRPVYHQKEKRCDGHLFISVIAYHILHYIRIKLKQQGINDSWSTIRRCLSGHYRVTTSMKRSDGKMIYVRKTSKPEDCHIRIYNALGLPHRPGKVTKTIL